MSLSPVNIFLVASFVLLGLKWFTTGYYGRVAGQLVFLFPLVFFVYLSVLAILYKSHPVSGGLRKQGKYGGLPKFQLNRAGRLQAVLLFLYLLIFSVALFRSVGASGRFSFFIMSGRFLTAVLIAMAGYFIFRVYARSGQLDRAWTLIIIGLSLYVIINVLGTVVGIRNEFVEIQDRTKGDIVLSLWSTRISFPFSANHHAFAVEAGLLGAMVIGLFFQPRCRHRFLCVLVLLLATGAILAANVRTPFVALALVAAAGIAWKQGVRKLILPLLIIVLIFPIFFTYVDILPSLENLPVDISFLSRRGNLSELSTFNSRTMIWGHMFDEFSNMKPIHLVGFGAFGPAVTGLCYDYAWMWPEPELITLHNTYLQYLIDFGYIGLLIFLAMIINAFKVLGKTNKVVGRKSVHVFHPAIAAMLYLACCGLFEVNIYFNQILTFYVFIFINYQVIWHGAGTKLQPGTELKVR